MRKGADTDPAAALPTAPGGSAAAPGAEGNPTDPKDPGQRAGPGGPGPGRGRGPTAAAARGPATGEPPAGPGSAARAVTRTRPRTRAKGRTRRLMAPRPGTLQTFKAGLEHLTPAEQAKARLQLVLEAAAKADEALKAKERSEEEAKRRKEEDQATLLDQVKRVKEIEAIESDAFVPQTFRSSKEVKKSTEAPEVQQEPGSVGAGGAPEAAAAEKEPPAANIPTAIKYQDDNSLAHPNLFMEKAQAEEKWFQRLVALRQERLMGSPVA
ncbi:serine/Arginine-related protein 53 [Sylvia atricapilla]|uniref:serine/Arginine-related protein 53 n=1 Tax=Sylvia atricapilla TaxID=48155 RepID=UPI00339079F2